MLRVLSSKPREAEGWLSPEQGNWITLISPRDILGINSSRLFNFFSTTNDICRSQTDTIYCEYQKSLICNVEPIGRENYGYNIDFQQKK
jgi:hypothetical protein